MHAENTILVQFLQAALGIFLVIPFCGCTTPQAIIPDSPVAKHDQEIPSVTIHTNYPIPQEPVNIRTNYPSPSALLWSINYRNSLGYTNYPIYREQEESPGAFFKGIGDLDGLYTTFRFIDAVLRVIP